MKKEDYRRKALLFSELVTLAIMEGNFDKVEQYQKEVAKALEAMLTASA